MLCRLYSPHIGGVERHVEGISKEAVQEGHHVDIFTLKHDRALATNEDKDGVHIHRMPSQLHSRVLRYVSPPLLKTILRLSGNARSAQDDKVKKMTNYIVERDELWGWMLWNLPTFIMADVIHIHDVFFWYWPIRILLFWKPVYMTFHGFEAGGLPTEKAKKTRQMITRWTRGNIAVGSWIEKWYGTKADEVTYGGAECGGKKILDQTASRLDKDDNLKAVFVGRIAEDTGALVYKKVLGSLPNVKLDLYGEGSENGTIEDSCTVFPSYDIACVSSYLSILEAMQSKTLVVAFAVNELKYDYLRSHPRAEDMVILRTEVEMRAFFDTFSKKNYQHRIDSAYDWAKQQTWNRVYRKYKKLWNV